MQLTEQHIIKCNDPRFAIIDAAFKRPAFLIWTRSPTIGPMMRPRTASVGGV
ncbi:MAG TPA: hypothetical protein VFB12_11930 [Ktedonobacteraceae bacterium]|nr:hypothetical protein [Ktedonobacteraceae bacterium]